MDPIKIIQNCNHDNLITAEAAIAERRADLSVIIDPSPYSREKDKRINDYDYEIEGFGDMVGDYNGGYKCLPKRRLHSLRAALSWLEIWGLVDKFDPEDDRVVIWETCKLGHRKAVWHASGWHWASDEVDGQKLEQGALTGSHRESVYAEAMRYY